MEQITKKDARKEAYKLIKNNDSAISSMIVIKRLIESKILEKYNNIGIYYPIGNEISVIPLVKYYNDKSFYLPITKDKLYFSKYNYLDELVDGPFNTKEPNGPITKRDDIECFIIPCVAISNNKRIGYGKGFYDKYLEGYKGLKIGVCYKNTSGFNCLMDEFDVNLDMIFVG